MAATIAAAANATATPASESSKYPRSRPSVSLNQTVDSIVRSSLWSEELLREWNEPHMQGLETVGERARRYLVYFTLSLDQMKVIQKALDNELTTALKAHSMKQSVMEVGSPNTLKVMETFVHSSKLPSSNMKGSALAVDFTGPVVDVGIVTLQGNGRIKVDKERTLDVRNVKLQGATTPLKRGLAEASVTASQLFDAIAELVPSLDTITATQTAAANSNAGSPKTGAANSNAGSPKAATAHSNAGSPKAATAHSNTGSPKTAAPAKSSSSSSSVAVGFSFGFPCLQRRLDSALLLHWTRNLETGRGTIDPVEGSDPARLLECALARRKVSATVPLLVNDSVALLAASYYQSSGAARMSVTVGSGLNAALVLEQAQHYGYVGDIVNTELGGFGSSLPLNDIDLEVDFADHSCQGKQLLEKMVGVENLGELCRRLIVKVWENEAPAMAWHRRTLPWTACVRILEDNDPDRLTTDTILRTVWSWETKLQERRSIAQLFEAVFNRAAALLAISIVSLGSRTGFMQRAMGGFVCYLGGDLLERYPKFLTRIETNVAKLVADASQLVRLVLCCHGALKGAGVLLTAGQIS